MRRGPCCRLRASRPPTVATSSCTSSTVAVVDTTAPVYCTRLNDDRETSPATSPVPRLRRMCSQQRQKLSRVEDDARAATPFRKHQHLHAAFYVTEPRERYDQIGYLGLLRKQANARAASKQNLYCSVCDVLLLLCVVPGCAIPPQSDVINASVRSIRSAKVASGLSGTGDAFGSGMGGVLIATWEWCVFYWRTIMF